MMRILLFLATNLAVVFVASITLSLLGVGSYMTAQGLDYNNLLIFCLIFGMAGSIISLLLSKFMAKRSMGVQIIDQPQNADQQWLYSTVQELANKANIGMPEVGVFNSAQANAFATGWNKNNALVAVSTGLLSSMQKNEVEAVLAHEVSHVANGDMVTMTLIQGVVNTFVVFLSRVIGHIVDRVIFKVERGHGPAFWIVSIITEIILGLLATMLVMWFSRYREYKADLGGAKLAGRANMIAALKRLQSFKGAPELPDEMAAFAINAGKVQALFSSHPPLEQRINALQNLRT